MRSILRKLRRLAREAPGRRALLIEAVLGLLIARAALRLFPFHRLARGMGDFVPQADPRTRIGRRETSPDRAALARQIGWAVTRAARHAPFEAVCLPQAMTARRMLARRGIAGVMHFGAAKGTDKPIDAHAWLDAEGVEVTGYPVGEGFVEIGCFVPDAESTAAIGDIRP